MKTIMTIAVCLTVAGVNAWAATWNVADGKWENPSNWDGNSVPENEVAEIIGGTVRIDSSSGSLVAGPSSGNSVKIKESAALNISGGALYLRTGFFATDRATLAVSGGLLETTNTLSFKNSTLTLSDGGHVVVGNGSGDKFFLEQGSVFNYTGGEMDITGNWNLEKTGQNTSVLNHIGLIGGGDFNAISIGNALYPAQVRLNITAAPGATFNPGDTFIIFEFKSGAWEGEGDDHLFTAPNGELIQDLDWDLYGDSSQDDAIIPIGGTLFYVNYNFNVSNADSTYNIINTGNYHGTGGYRQVALTAIEKKPLTIRLLASSDSFRGVMPTCD